MKNSKILLSKFTTGIITAGTFILILLCIVAYPNKYPRDEKTIETFVEKTIQNWQAEYEGQEGMKVARIDILFRAGPKNFVPEEGTVIAPIGQNLPGGQEIIDSAVYPPSVRDLSVDGIQAKAWTYPGKYRTDLRYVGLCLVKQLRIKSELNGQPSYNKLPEHFISDALATAGDLEEHSLHECAAFPEWSQSIAGEGNYIERFKTIVTKIASGVIPLEQEKKDRSRDDICAAMRKNKMTRHRAHVLSVMACRQVGIPCFSFVSAEQEDNYLIGTYSDQAGWLYFDFAKPDKGFFNDPPVLLTRVPLITRFQGSNHEYWNARASAYQTTDWGIYAFTWTAWGSENRATDYTMAKTFNLGD